MPAAVGESAGTRASSGAENIANAGKLGKQLASEQQTMELLRGRGEPIAGAGTNKPINDIARITSEYGGSETSWQKVTRSAYKSNDGSILQSRAYQNVETGEVQEVKTRITTTK